ncbi:hypothetical protein DXG01_002449 [Tephrocybe rancida]|nr:hypothetical protein DXG01_002449 [Tephrocybe rancida]
MIASTPNILRIQRALKSSGKRAYHDLITLPGQKPIASQGPPGYSAVSGHVVTVFGCTGFLGSPISSSETLSAAKMGTQVIIPYRDEDEARIFKPMGDLGQIVRMEWDIRNENQIAECVRHSDIVYNLAGRDFETKNFDFKSVHVDGAERIANIAAQSGVSRFVHVSHLNASAKSESKFYQTKAEGEERVKAAFPTATIVRPGTLFGYEDKLLTNMAVWPIWWKLNHGETKIRPVHVMDVAQALANLMSIPQLSGTINLPGPSTLTYEYLLELVASITMQPPSSAPVLPKAVASFLAKAAQSVWWPALSPDEVVRRYINDVDVPGDWATVSMGEPSEIENHAITYLRRYRSA